MKKAIKIGELVQAREDYSMCTVVGTFEGFCLADNENPNSVVGQVLTLDKKFLRYVKVESIEIIETENKKFDRVIRLALTDVPEERFKAEGITLKDCYAWLDKMEENSKLNDSICSSCTRNANSEIRR